MIADPEAAGRAAAQALLAGQQYSTFHQSAPDRTVPYDVRGNGLRKPARGRCAAVVYKVPDSLPSSRRGAPWRHLFGDTGHGDTGARPELYAGTPRRLPAHTTMLGRILELALDNGQQLDFGGEGAIGLADPEGARIYVIKPLRGNRAEGLCTIAAAPGETPFTLTDRGIVG